MSKLFSSIQILATMGIVLAIYLLHQQLIQPAFSPCYINATVNCDAIIKGEVAKTFGIPTPLYGLVGYIIILFAAFRRLPKLLFGMAAFGASFCTYIGYIELIVLKTICPVCIACMVIMYTTFTLSVILYRQSSHETVSA